MNKLERLEEVLKSYQKVAIAYSGGCDSNFLLHEAIKTLGKDNVLAIMCQGAMISKEDLEDAKTYLQDVQYEIVPLDVFQIDEFVHNDKKRCYFCKKQVMTTVIEHAKKKGFEKVLDGMNKDDTKVYRPGRQACQELGILSPMVDVDLSKKEIREYSRMQGVVTYNKPANACLASRYDYGTLLTKEKLELVDQAEQIFHNRGIMHVRVRVNENTARIEVNQNDFIHVIEDKKIVEELKSLGFRYVVLDLEGITSGGYDR